MPMTKHPKEESTVLIVKPDGVKRGLVGEIISRIEKRGLKIIALRMIWPTRENINDHYPKDEVWIKRVGEKTLATYEKYGLNAKAEFGSEDPLVIGKEVRSWQLDFLTSGPVVKMVIKGVHARDMLRKLIGATMPAQAELGSIRGDFSVDSAAAANRDKRAVYNLVHASETEAEFENEKKLWFTDDEVHDYERSEDKAIGI